MSRTHLEVCGREKMGHGDVAEEGGVKTWTLDTTIRPLQRFKGLKRGKEVALITWLQVMTSTSFKRAANYFKTPLSRQYNKHEGVKGRPLMHPITPFRIHKSIILLECRAARFLLESLDSS